MCSQHTPYPLQLAAWTAETGISPSYENLLNYFHHRVAALVKHNGKRMVAWQDTYDHVGDTNIDPTVAIQPWMCWANRGDMALSTATNAHRGVLQSMCWCVVYRWLLLHVRCVLISFDCPRRYLDYESTWVDYYHHDPFPSKMRITDDQKQLVWGGESMWLAVLRPMCLHLHLACGCGAGAVCSQSPCSQRVWMPPISTAGCGLVPQQSRSVSGATKRCGHDARWLALCVLSWSCTPPLAGDISRASCTSLGRPPREVGTPWHRSCVVQPRQCGPHVQRGRKRRWLVLVAVTLATTTNTRA